MQYVTVKAATSADQELGAFAAIAATYSVDRQREQIRRGAFRDTIERWRASGKRIPVHWNHESSAASVIGWIDPHSMSETGQGLYVTGKLDIDTSDVAREAWRSMRNGSMSLSFGYMTNRSRDRGDGVKELLEIDLYEISIVPVPANSDTRILEMKGATRSAGDYRYPDEIDLRSVEQDEKAAAYAREYAPVRIVTFPC